MLICKHVLEFHKSAWVSHPGLSVSTYWRALPRRFPELPPKWEKWACHVWPHLLYCCCFCNSEDILTNLVSLQVWWIIFHLSPCSLLRHPRKQKTLAVEDNLHSLLIQMWVEGQNVGPWKEFVSDSSIKISVLILPQLTCNDSQEFLSQKWGQTYWLFFLSSRLFNTGRMVVLIIKLSEIQGIAIIRKDSISRSKYPPSWWTYRLLASVLHRQKSC